jgi:hemolysin activation/secretion protein
MFAKLFLYTSLGFLGFGAQMSCLAQILERPSIKKPQSDIPSLQAPPSTPILRSLDPTSSRKDTVSEPIDRINVLHYEVVGSTIFNHAQLDDITQKYKGKVSFDQIQSAANAVEMLYHKAGYQTTGAYIPANQQLSIDGCIVKIQVLEGGLEAIQVKGTDRLNTNYIRSRLLSATQAPLQQERLLDALRLLQQNPLIEQISAELSVGTQPGKNLLEVTIKEVKPIDMQVSSDNNRSSSVGSWQRRIQAKQTNILGLGDILSIGYGNTQGSNSWNFSYDLPLSPTNTNLSFNFGRTRSDVIEEPFNKLDIISKSRYYEVSLRQPIIQSAKEKQIQEFAIGLAGSRIESETSLLDIPFKLSEGADNSGQTRLTALRFFQEYSSRSNREVLSFRSQFNFGLNALGSTVNLTGADSRFFHWEGKAYWLRQLQENLSLVVQGKIQLADRPLPSLEQFAIGGASTVRGYRQDVRVADSGIFGSIELQTPIWHSRQKQSVLQLAPFADIGTVWSRDPFSTLENQTLASIGLGVAWHSPRWNARIDWGIPLISIDGRKNSLQENGLYLSVRYSIF